MRENAVPLLSASLEVCWQAGAVSTKLAPDNWAATPGQDGKQECEAFVSSTGCCFCHTPSKKWNYRYTEMFGAYLSSSRQLVSVSTSLSAPWLSHKYPPTFGDVMRRFLSKRKTTVTFFATGRCCSAVDIHSLHNCLHAGLEARLKSPVAPHCPV